MLDAERHLADAYRAIVRTGTNNEDVNMAFAIARECFAEIKRELDLAHYERLAARSLRAQADPPREAIVPDLPGQELCPDPATARTPSEFLTTLRMYHIWAGKPSYRAMARQCGKRFAASTICTALHSEKLPKLDMVLAIIQACRGSDQHERMFTSAWRRLQMR